MMHIVRKGNSYHMQRNEGLDLPAYSCCLIRPLLACEIEDISINSEGLNQATY